MPSMKFLVKQRGKICSGMIATEEIDTKHPESTELKILKLHLSH